MMLILLTLMTTIDDTRENGKNEGKGEVGFIHISVDTKQATHKNTSELNSF